ncbi:hypothetical protein VTO42DRAFT_442 [Malbranchea cinnamomea]
MESKISTAIPPFPSDLKTADLITVDFTLLADHDPAEITRLYEAAKTQGFLYLRNHGVEPSFMFELASSLFGLPTSEKMKYDMGTKGYYYGYKPRGTQYVDANGKPDTQEYYNISKDEILKVVEGGRGHPQPIYKYWKDLEKFTRASHVVVTTVLRVLGEKLGLDPELLPSLHKLDRPGGDHARITWTPPGNEENTITFGAHTDFGSVTLLFNRLGGLQVIDDVTKEWTYVKPIPDFAILNFGDSIVKLLGGRVLSGMHRVVSAPGEQGKLHRVSVVYFSRPNGDVPLKCVVPGDVPEDEGEVLTADEWIKRRAIHRHTANYKGKESYILSKGTERNLD